MSVRADAIAMYGIYCHTEVEAIAFVHSNGHPEVEELCDEPSYFELEGLYLACLNLYTGRPYLLGFELKLGETLDEVKRKWATVFPNSNIAPQEILEVRQY